MSETLLPCPFCGADPVAFEQKCEDGGYSAIECNTCHGGEGVPFIGVHANSPGEAKEIWNTRTKSDAGSDGAVAWLRYDEDTLMGFWAREPTQHERDRDARLGITIRPVYTRPESSDPQFPPFGAEFRDTSAGALMVCTKSRQWVRVVESSAKPAGDDWVEVPSGVYFRNGNFYDARSRIGMGDEFYAQWHKRASEFPGSPAAPKREDEGK